MLFKACVLKSLLVATGKWHFAQMHPFFKIGPLIFASVFRHLRHVQRNKIGLRNGSVGTSEDTERRERGRQFGRVGVLRVSVMLSVSVESAMEC